MLLRSLKKCGDFTKKRQIVFNLFIPSVYNAHIVYFSSSPKKLDEAQVFAMLQNLSKKGDKAAQKLVDELIKRHPELGKYSVADPKTKEHRENPGIEHGVASPFFPGSELADANDRNRFLERSSRQIIEDEDDAEDELDYDEQDEGEDEEEDKFQVDASDPDKSSFDLFRRNLEGKSNKSMEHLTAVARGSVDIPQSIRDRITDILKTYDIQVLKSDIHLLINHLKSREATHINKDNNMVGSKTASTGSHLHPMLRYDNGVSMAYLATRFAGVYGCNCRVFKEIKERLPEYAPKTMLDFGSGPGTSVISAKTLWEDEHLLHTVTAVEPSEYMTSVGQKLIKKVPTLRHRKLLLQGKDEGVFDLVTASYALSEFSSAANRRAVVMSLWRKTEENGLLVIIEPSTKVGFHVIKEARRVLLDDHVESGKIIAPCPHAYECPLQTDEQRICNFAQTVNSFSTHKSIKPAKGGAMSEKFCYLVFQKLPLHNNSAQTVKQSNTPMARILKILGKQKGHVNVSLCLPSGEETKATVSKSTGKSWYLAARKSKWGDLIEVPPQKNPERVVLDRRWSVRKKTNFTNNE